MDFKSLLQTMDNISETVHKAGPGGYGNRHGSEIQTDQYGKPIGKVSLASLAPKDDKPKKRGAPVKADKPLTGKDDPKNQKVRDIFGRTTGDVPKGKKGTQHTPMKDADKEEKKAEKKSLKDWIEVSEHNQLNEEDVSVKPIQASQIIGADGKSMGTADPATANAIKAAAEKGTLNLSGDDSSSTSSSSTSSQPMTEKSEKPVKTDASAEGKYKGKSKSELLKAFKHLKKTGPHEKDSTQYRNMKELAIAIRAKGVSGKVETKEKAVDESALQASFGYDKYGEPGMRALQDAGRNNASEKTKQNIRAEFSDKEEPVSEGGREMTGTARDRFISTMTPRMDNDALMQKVAKVVNSPEFTEDTILKIVDAGNTVTHPVARYIQKEFEELQYDLGREYEDYPERVAEKLLAMLIDRTKQGVSEGDQDWMKGITAMAHKMAPQDKMRQRQAERDAQSQSERQQKIQQDIENLPDLISQYNDMKTEYESMGGSNWQYADSEQNLSAEERRARNMETSMRQLADRIHTAKKASLGQGETPKYPRTSDRMRQAQYRHNGFPRPRSESISEADDDFEQEDEAYIACIVQHNRSGQAVVQRTKPISRDRAEEVIKHALSKNTFVHPPFMTIYPANAGKLDGSTIMAQFPDMSQEAGPGNTGMMESAKKKTMSRAAKGYDNEQLDEISQKLATKTYAKRDSEAFDRHDYATNADDSKDADKASAKAKKTYDRIGKRFGADAQKKADKAADKEIFGKEKDLPGKQDKLDVAPPKGKLTGADFKALSKKKKVKEGRVMQILEGINFKDLMASADSEVQEMLIELQNDVELFKKTGHTSDLIDSFLKVHLHHNKSRITDEAAGAGRGSVNPPAVNPSAPLPPARSAAPGWGRDDYKPLVPFDTSPKSSMGTIKGGVWTADPPKPGERGVPIPMDLEAVPEGNFLSTLGQSNKTFESKIMKDIQLESWEKELNSLLTVNEGITVSTSTGQQGSPDSVSVNATDGDSAELLQVLRQAGLGVFGGEEERSSYGSPMHSQEPTGAGSEPEMSPAVVGDGDDMMALIKKMSGIQDSGEPEGVAVVDVSSEEGEDEHSHYGSDNHNHEEQGEEEVDEGNFYAHNVLKAKEAGETEADLDGDGDMEQVKEQDRLISKANSNDGTVSTSSSTGRIQATMGPNGISVSPKPSVQNGEDSNKKAQKQDESHDHKDHETCNECGMYEARCVCEPGEEQVEEDYANEAGHEEMASLKHLLNAGNDMHYPKEKQSVGNPTKVTFETKLLKDSTSLLQDFRKLSGIK